MDWFVLLIGGPSGVGKTTVAPEIARRLGAGWLMVDDLRLALARSGLPVPNADAVGRFDAPGGLVTLTYDDYTVVEVATDPDEPTIAKFIEGGPIEDVVVHGHAGMWIPEAHRIGYIDRSGKLDFDTLRRAGPVLLWSVDDVTFRVEGPPTLDEAMAVANTIV